MASPITPLLGLLLFLAAVGCAAGKSAMLRSERMFLGASVCEPSTERCLEAFVKGTALEPGPRYGPPNARKGENGSGLTKEIQCHNLELVEHGVTNVVNPGEKCCEEHWKGKLKAHGSGWTYKTCYRKSTSITGQPGAYNKLMAAGRKLKSWAHGSSCYCVQSTANHAKGFGSWMVAQLN